MAVLVFPKAVPRCGAVLQELDSWEQPDDSPQSALREAHLADCALCREEVARRRLLRSTLRELDLDVALPKALQARLDTTLRSDTRRWPLLLLVAGFSATAIMGVIAGVQGGVLGAGTEAAAVRVVIAAAQARHEQLLPVDVATPDVRSAEAFLAGPLGRKIAVPSLDRMGFTLQGGRVVDVGDKRGAQLVYRGGAGHRLSLLAVPWSGRSPIGAGAVVHARGALYAAAGDIDEDTLGAVRIALVEGEPAGR